VISKGALIATHPVSSRRRVHVKTDQTRPAAEAEVRQIGC